MARKTAGPNQLVVPMKVYAFCVGSGDSTTQFAGVTTDFSMLPYPPGKQNPYLSHDTGILRSLDEAPLNPLETGIHLHWVLPESLTRGAHGAKAITFPALPNRWLVTRVLQSGKSLTTRSWVIQSDFLSNAQTGTSASRKQITLPLPLDTTLPQPYQYLGSVGDAATWKEPNPTGPSKILTATGHELHSLTAADPGFAGFYPNSQNVFGHFDDGTGVTGSLSYTVIGWYSEAKNDPLSGQLTLEEIEARYHWTFDSTDIPTSILCHGTVQNVDWNPATPYVAAGVLEVDVSIGNSNVEALSAIIADKLQVQKSENLLSAFQMGLINDFSPGKKTEAKLHEELHAYRFGSRHGGTLWVISKANARSATTPSALPPAIGSALNQLNLAQKAFDDLGRQLSSKQLEAFFDWYRYLLTDIQTDPALFSDVQQYLESEVSVLFGDQAQPGALLEQLAAAQKAVQAQEAAVELLLQPTEYRLRKTAAPRFWHPNEPYILLYGEPVDRNWRNDTLALDENGNLPCLVTQNLMTGITVLGGPKNDKPCTVSASDFSAIHFPSDSQITYRDNINSLLSLSCLLDPNLLAAWGAIASDQIGLLEDQLRAFLRSHIPTTLISAVTGPPPSLNCAIWWDGENPFLPVFLSWSVDYGAVDVPSGDYQANFITENYALDFNHDTEFSFLGGSPQSLLPGELNYRGSAILTSKSTYSLQEQIKKARLSNGPQLLESIEALPIMGQALSGFNNALLMRSQTLQLPVANPNPQPHTGHGMDAPIAQAVAFAVGKRNSLAPHPHAAFNPIRAGFMNVQLAVIDAFGQKKAVEPKTLYVSDSLGVSGQPSLLGLPPRLVQGARLLFRWLSAGKDTVEMNADPATTPVCGWIMANHVDDSLMLYSPGGELLGLFFLSGEVALADRKILWQAAPGNQKTFGQDPQTVFANENEHLKSFALHFASPSCPASFFYDFVRGIDEAASNVQPDSFKAHQDLAVLMGRPLALVQTSVRLELEGAPALNLSWSALRNDCQRQSGSSFPRTHNGFTDVEFSIVFGKTRNLNDGLIGYFAIDPRASAYDYTTFYAQSLPDPTQNSGVVPSSSKPLTVTAGSGAQRFLMILDPRASVHLTSGILPVKSIDLPKDHYKGALRNIHFTMLAAPIVSSATETRLPLPDEKGRRWSWILAESEKWDVTKVADLAPLGNLPEGPQSIEEGWLQLSREE